MKYILLIIILFSLSLHWHHKEEQRVREYVYARTDIDAEPGVAPHHTELDDVIVMASEHFNISIQKVNTILQEAE